MLVVPDLIESPLWHRLSSAQREQWAVRCISLLRLAKSPPPFDSAVEASIDLSRLDSHTEHLDLALLAGVPQQAVRARQLAVFAGRLCAEAALAVQGMPLRAPIGRDLAGGPIWPTGWTGSITHADGVAMAAVQHRRGLYDIGLDTEALIAEPLVQRAVEAQCLHAVDRQGWQPAGRPDVLTLLFSAKEAYYKAVRRRVGRMVDFHEVHLSPERNPDGLLQLRPVAGADCGLPEARASYRWIGSRILTRVAVVDENDRL